MLTDKNPRTAKISFRNEEEVLSDKGSEDTLPADLPAKNVKGVLQAEVWKFLQAETWKCKFTQRN